MLRVSQVTTAQHIHRWWPEEIAPYMECSCEYTKQTIKRHLKTVGSPVKYWNIANEKSLP